MRVDAPMQGTIVSVDVSVGDEVATGQQLMLIESMKMHHSIESPCDGSITALLVEAGATVMAGVPVATVEPGIVRPQRAADAAGADLTAVRPDLAEVQSRHEIGLDAARPTAVGQRRAVGRRTARENVADLVDDGSFVEYGPVVIAAQRRRRAVQDLIERTPADGMIGGIGTVNGHLFEGRAGGGSVIRLHGPRRHAGPAEPPQRTVCSTAETMRLPVVFFTEGGGGPATPTAPASAASTVGVQLLRRIERIGAAGE
jgi:pyruvate/2-oxoglutarate dehydrogenase complex dihydrolipoamide acyltransferase (E2) component